MNEFYENILKRRSIKKYKSDPVKKEDIDKIINAGLYAANGKGMQSPVIIAITDKQVRDNLSKENAKVLGIDMDPFYNAPLVLVVLAPKDYFTYIYDGSLVMGNMMFAAQSLGLGSCWIHRAKEVFESDYGKSILKKLNISDKYEGIGNLIVGYPDCEIPKPAPRKDGRVYYI